MYNKLIISIIAIACLGLSACDSNNTPIDKTQSYVLSDELKDCKITEIKGQAEYDIIVTRCPLSTTTTSYTESCGKGCTRTFNNNVTDENDKKDKDQYVVIDGEKYKLIKE